MNFLSVLLLNVSRLFKVSSKKKISWDYIASSSVDCQIDDSANVHHAHHLFKSVIQSGTAIGPNCNISYTTIGRFCSIGPNILCGWGIHPLNGISTSPAFYSTLKQNGFTFSKYDKIEERKLITIGNDVFIGANVTVLDGVTIGDGAVIGAGAIVSKDIPAYAVAAGNPIKIIRYRFDEEKIKQLLEIKWWNGDLEMLKKVEKYFFNIDEFLASVANTNNKAKNA